MKALILVGGLGTRLRSVIQNIPKPMAPVGGRPFLEYQIRWLIKYGFTDIVLCIGYLGDYIKNYFGDGSRLGVKIEYSYEKELLGTAGAIKNAENLIPKGEPFLVLNGDSYAKIDFNKLIEFHNNKKSKFTIGVTKAKDMARYGGVEINNEGKVIYFAEKAGKGKYINGGVYLFEPELLGYIPKNKRVSLETEIFQVLVKKGLLNAHVWDGYFIDMGVPESYSQLQQDILESMLVNENFSVRDAMINIDNSGLGIALVVDKKRRLKGLITDGDIRRFIIKEDDLNRKVKEIMIKNPVTARLGWPKEKIYGLINPRIKHIPLVDDNNIVRDVVLYTDLKEEPREASIVRAKAPLRVSFAGGGTDIDQYFRSYGGYVLSTTIDKYCYGTLIRRNDPKISIKSFDFDVEEKIESISEITYSGKLDLIKAVIKLLKPNFGFDLYLYSDVPPGSGLGSSAAIAAVVAGLLNHLREDRLDDYQLADLIYKAEREEIKIDGGWQDQYATIFGGFNFIEFKKEEIIVHPLRVQEDVLNELNSNLFLCYTGKTRVSGDIIKNQKKSYVMKKEEVMVALAKLKDITLNIRSALLKGKMEEFGNLLHEAWENKKRLDSKVSDSYINELYDIAIKNGALGGKILGAGGGGYLLFFCPVLKKKYVIKKLNSAGGRILDFSFDSKGLISWSARK